MIRQLGTGLGLWKSTFPNLLSFWAKLAGFTDAGCGTQLLTKITQIQTEWNPHTYPVWLLKGTLRGLIFYPSVCRRLKNLMKLNFENNLENTSAPKHSWREGKLMKSFWKAVLIISIEWKISVNFEQLCFKNCILHIYTCNRRQRYMYKKTCM